MDEANEATEVAAAHVADAVAYYSRVSPKGDIEMTIDEESKKLRVNSN